MGVALLLIYTALFGADSASGLSPRPPPPPAAVGSRWRLAATRNAVKRPIAANVTWLTPFQPTLENVYAASPTARATPVYVAISFAALAFSPPPATSTLPPTYSHDHATPWQAMHAYTLQSSSDPKLKNADAA